jgi:glycosyltransferase involved in cell wall biosynthesis
VRLAINAVPLLLPASGVAQYIRGLVRALLWRSDIECLFFSGYGWSRTLREKPLPGSSRLKSLLLAALPRPEALMRLAQQSRFRRIESLGCDVYHEPNYFPFTTHLPTVTTIHDLSPIRFPHTHSTRSRRKWDALLLRALQASRLIVTDSEFVRSEIVSTFGTDPAKVKAIPLGVSNEYHQLARNTVREGLVRYGLESRKYSLAVGTLEPRKNLVTALEAYSGLPLELARRFPLIIVGGRGWLTMEIDQAIKNLERQGRARWLGYIPQSDMPMLYSGAKLLVYPSLYEGFGFPPLEAMACGTPVITSNCSSLPEVVGDAAIQLDPMDVEALRRAVLLLLQDSARWDLLREAGLSRARMFSWDRCAESTIAAYRAACAA